ncbi:hypothetical protein V5F72_08590 [Xanthobacter flavus]|uniref:hypothetical protein n=1 Tax=Xanthobacter flavus TaxID=281 RepID=UPI0037288119
MTSSGTPNAYLVMAMVSEEGKLLLQSETVCFDRDLAFAMADDDGDHCTWVGVYALDAEGRNIQNGALYSSGSLHGFGASERSYRNGRSEPGLMLS